MHTAARTHTLSSAMSAVKSLVVWYHVNTALSGMVVVTLTHCTLSRVSLCFVILPLSFSSFIPPYLTLSSSVPCTSLFSSCLQLILSVQFQFCRRLSTSHRALCSLCCLDCSLPLCKRSAWLFLLSFHITYFYFVHIGFFIWKHCYNDGIIFLQNLWSLKIHPQGAMNVWTKFHYSPSLLGRFSLVHQTGGPTDISIPEPRR